MVSTPQFVKSVVNTCLRIGKDDKVMIFAWRHMLDLAEEFALECRRVGAQTHTEFGTDELFYQTILTLPLEHLRQANPFSLAMLDVATANIIISGPENPERLKQITPERASAIAIADKPFYQKLLERKVRTTQINLGLATRQRAKTYGFDYDAWKQNITAAMDVKYEYMRDLGKKLGNALEKAHEVHITKSKGTDLRLELGGRGAHVHDGVIDDEDIEKGAFLTALPTGLVAVAPTETSARGKLVSDVPEPFYGVLIREASLDFKDGKLMSFKGDKSIETVKAKWKMATGDKDRIGSLLFGLNPKARTGFAHNDIVLGTVGVGIGDNIELGGDNEADFVVRFMLTEPTVELDGKPVIKNGKFDL